MTIKRLTALMVAAWLSFPSHAAEPAATPTMEPVPPISEYEKGMSTLPDQILQDERQLTPELLREFKRLRHALEREAAAPVGTPGIPVSRSVSVSLAPGAVPLPIRLEPNVVTSLVFSDSTGAPWPIADFSPGAADVLQLPDKGVVVSKKMNVLTLALKQDFVSTNLSILLEGANAPLVFAVVSGQKKTDYRLDINVQAKSPLNTAETVVSGFESGIRGEMQDILDGTPPESAVELKITGDESARAWKIGEFFYVRTRTTITSPAAISAARSVDGMQAFKLPETPLMYAIAGGKFITLRLSGY